jgi:hypothetical protein
MPTQAQSEALIPAFAYGIANSGGQGAGQGANADVLSPIRSIFTTLPPLFSAAQD